MENGRASTGPAVTVNDFYFFSFIIRLSIL